MARLKALGLRPEGPDVTVCVFDNLSVDKRSNVVTPTTKQQTSFDEKCRKPGILKTSFSCLPGFLIPALCDSTIVLLITRLGLNNMHARILVSAVVCFSYSFGVSVAGDEKQDVAKLEQLLSDVKKVVPSGWTVAISLANSKIPSRRGSHPTLVIRSAKPLPVEHFYPSMRAITAGNPKPPPMISQEVVSLYFVASPFMSRQTFKAARDRNAALLGRRLQFERKHLKEVERTYKGGEPIPPYAFEPRTERESQLIGRYAFLWISTIPQPVPTHHTDHLSFEMHRPGSFKIHDAKKSREFDQIFDASQEILVPYEKRP